MDDVLKQAKLKALSLLTDMDRTEEQLRQKLRQKDYSDEIVEQAIAYVKSFGYINDAGYAKRFVENRRNSKSRQELRAALSQKGISSELIEEALETAYETDDELEAIRALARKRHFSPENCSEEEKKRFFYYLMRKGFRYDSIRKVMKLTE